MELFAETGNDVFQQLMALPVQAAMLASRKASETV
jgi:hypothetical protein